MATTINSDSNTLIAGTAEDDNISSDYSDSVTIVGNGGNDFIFNYESDFVSIDGGEGNDTITNYYANNSSVYGGAGNDSVFLIENQNSFVDGGAGNDYIQRTDSIAAVNTITGGTGDDSIFAFSNGGNVYVYNEGEGNDTIQNYLYTTDTTAGGWTYSDTYSLQINSSVGWSSVVSGNNIVVTVGDGSITLVDAATSSGVNINGVTYPIDTTDSGVTDNTVTDNTVTDNTVTDNTDTDNTVTDNTDTDNTDNNVTDNNVTDNNVTDNNVTDNNVTDNNVTDNGGTDTPVTLPPDTPVTPETLPPAVGGAAYDIVFILDVSGSMGYYINRVNAIAQTFVDKLAERGITDYRIGVMEYETASVIYPLDVYGSLFTTDINAFTSAMAVASNGTRGGTENGLTALNDAVSNYALQARPEANKEFILLTDEDFDDGATVSVSGIEQLLNDNGIQLDVIGAVDGSCDSAWTPVARNTGGNFYDINGNYTETFNEIVLNLDCVNVNLATVPDGQTGWFLLVPGNHVTDLKSVDAVFVSATDPNLEAYAQVLEVVGMVSADKVYNAASSRYRQNVTIPDLWNVTATSHADILDVAGTGFGVVIASGDGHDAVKLGESATGIILTDHDLSNDGLEFAKRQPLGTFTESVATDLGTMTNQVALTSPTMAVYLQNFSSPLQEEFDAKNAQFMAYGVTNGNRSDTVYDLLFSEDYVGDGNGRIMFAQWGYGFTPPEGNPLFVDPTLATSADLAADFGSPTLDEISPANFAVTANETPDQNFNAFNPKVAEMILATSKSKF